LPRHQSSKRTRPAAIRFNEGIRIVELPDVKERLRTLGGDPAPTTPEGFDAHIRAEVAKFRKIVQDAGIKPE
jgi:tripartite-type tricarboxylate transporter receptor subunit TctC